MIGINRSNTTQVSVPAAADKENIRRGKIMTAGTGFTVVGFADIENPVTRTNTDTFLRLSVSSESMLLAFVASRRTNEIR